MSPIILTPKRAVLPWAEARHLSHKAWISAAVRAGRWKKKKRTVQDTAWQVTKGLHLTYLGRSPHWNDLHQALCSIGELFNVVACVKFQNEIFRGYHFTGGRIFHFYCAPQCSHCKRCTSYGNSVRLSVRLSLCLSHAGIVSKRRHVARCVCNVR